MTYTIHQGDCRDVLDLVVEDESVQTCITSPPYFGLRDYGCDGQLGLESTPDEYVEQMVNVFRSVRRVLKDDGTLWLNLGDSYAGSRGAQSQRDGVDSISGDQIRNHPKRASNTGTIRQAGMKPKDLMGIPWRVAFALQADGWYLRQDIIWSKPNPMPESVTDRCTKAHEYLFLLSKSPKYFFDSAGISEPIAAASIARLSQDVANQAGSDRVPGKTNGTMKAVGRSGNTKRKPATERGAPRDGVAGSIPWEGTMRNKRSVWTVTTKPFKGAHFATFPPDLIEPCVLAGSRPGDLVLDPFGGSGTTAQVALKHGRRAVLCELNPEYIALAHERVAKSLKQ